MQPPWWDEIKHFTHDELKCSCCGGNAMQHGFMLTLDNLREYCGFPFIITSGYRCPAHNDAVSSTGRDGPHTTGRAVDIAVFGSQAFKLLSNIHRVGITGVGSSQKSSTAHSSRFIHLDDLPPDAHRPRPWVWTY